MRNEKSIPLYERLSRDDELQGESNSISNHDSLAGPDVLDALQLFLEIILAEKVLRLSQPCVIHHIAFDDELFQHPVRPNAEHGRLFGVHTIPTAIMASRL